MVERKKYPLVIIGAGPAGLTASIYASRYQLDHLVIGETLGGLAFEAYKICNFPTEKEISGPKLMEKFNEQIKSFKTPLLTDKVIDISQDKKMIKIVCQKGQTIWAEAILLAIGTKNRHLNLPAEDKYIGRGISYCATCDAMFYQNKVVAVVGGSDSANTTALYLADTAQKVYQIYRREKLRGMPVWVEQIKNNPKITVINQTRITGIKGEKKLEKVILDNPYQGKKELAVDGLFIEIGTIPNQTLIKKLSLKTDDQGYIKVKPDQKTNQPGVWAAGDITTASNHFHQIITACSEGAIAVESIFKFFQAKK
jgi:thioredoxin reductase (NADPH)